MCRLVFCVADSVTLCAVFTSLSDVTSWSDEHRGPVHQRTSCDGDLLFGWLTKSFHSLKLDPDSSNCLRIKAWNASLAYLAGMLSRDPLACQVRSGMK